MIWAVFITGYDHLGNFGEDFVCWFSSKEEADEFVKKQKNPDIYKILKIKEGETI